MSSDNAIIRLGELLEARGVEYGWDTETLYWDGKDGTAWTAERRHDNNLDLYCTCCLPEQAVAATLGSGTCTLPETRVDHGSIEYNGVTEWRKCSACGEEILAYPAHYCPNCGRKVVDE